MRTKTLLLTAALSAAGVATSMAQGTVFSVNAVGYVNTEVPAGFKMIANPLDAEDNSVGALITGVPNGTTLYKFDPATGQYAINSFLFGNWTDPAQTLNPGEGAFINNPGPDAFTITFVGEVPQGTLTQTVPAGFSIQASQVPQEGQVDTVLGFPAENGDTVYRFDTGTQQYTTHSFLFGSWQPAAPVVEVGESFFVSKVAQGTWTREFSVNP